MLESLVKPRGPYSLALSARRGGDATRVVRDGVITALVDVEGRPEVAQAWQLCDGRVALRAPSEPALESLRFGLALDADHSEFVRRFGHDPLLGETIRRFRGLRPLRVATVAHALLRAVCGQLIEARRARAIERQVIAAVTERRG